ncbi:MAG: protein phosphatase 2C domain-containing protein [Planctomycetia bacterium]|nr:protein phosphatase 2C domain-containing protein [Planctomycetia bacterium]
MHERNNNWWSDSLVFAALSNIGMRRSNNQDSYCVLPAGTPRLWRAKGHVFIVADGMGAHMAGEYASKLAVDVVSQAYLRSSHDDAGEALRAAIIEAHETIRKRGESDEQFHGMGTTCDALALNSLGAYIGHVGDSRVYRLRRHVYEQLTFDHSLVWEIQRNPAIHPRYRESHLPKNVITRSLGPTENLKVDIEGPFDLRPGDVFLMCSDGLSGQVADVEMGQILELFAPEEATETLVNLANLRSGPDNITVIVVAVKATPELPELEKECEKADKVYQKRSPISMTSWLCLVGALTSLAFLAILACLSFDKRALALCLCAALTLGFSVAFLTTARERFFKKRYKAPEPNKTFGKSPYTSVRIQPQEVFDQDIAKLCQSVCDAVHKIAEVEPDWNGVQNARAMAQKARQQNNLVEALRLEFRVINYMMRELKNYKQAKK